MLHYNRRLEEYKNKLARRARATPYTQKRPRGNANTFRGRENASVACGGSRLACSRSIFPAGGASAGNNNSIARPSSTALLDNKNHLPFDAGPRRGSARVAAYKRSGAFKPHIFPAALQENSPIVFPVKGKDCGPFATFHIWPRARGETGPTRTRADSFAGTDPIKKLLRCRRLSVSSGSPVPSRTVIRVPIFFPCILSVSVFLLRSAEDARREEGGVFLSRRAASLYQPPPHFS